MIVMIGAAATTVAAGTVVLMATKAITATATRVAVAVTLAASTVTPASTAAVVITAVEADSTAAAVASTVEAASMVAGAANRLPRPLQQRPHHGWSLQNAPGSPKTPTADRILQAPQTLIPNPPFWHRLGHPSAWPPSPCILASLNPVPLSPHTGTTANSLFAAFPFVLFRYKSRSAPAITLSNESPGSYDFAPTENVTVSTCPFTSTRNPSSRFNTSCNWVVSQSSSTSKNSSPPHRTARSDPRVELLRHFANSFSTISPARCPCVSLIVLKSFRSTSTTSIERPRLSERAISALRRCSANLRLYKPVSGSNIASRRNTSASICRSLSCL